MQHPHHRLVASSRLSKKSFGFTLVELMVTVAVLAILVAVAGPSLTSVVNQNRLSGTANEMVSSLQLARSEAMKRNVRTVICRSDDADAATPSCITTAGAWSGWIVFVDDGGTTGTASNGQRDGNEAVLRRQTVQAPLTIQPSDAVSGNSNRVTFRADGRAKTDTNALLEAKIGVCIASHNPAQNARDVTLQFGSRVSVDRRDGDGACAAPSNS